MINHTNTTRRRFLGTLGLGSLSTIAGLGLRPAAATAAQSIEAGFSTMQQGGMFELPPLPYDHTALEPTIDAETMMVHHMGHHATYVDMLNKLLAPYPEFMGMEPAGLLGMLDLIPETIRTKVRNNAGGHVNHSIFWVIMAPNAGGVPTGPLAQAIDATFGGFEPFKQLMITVGEEHFGSGWAWLAADASGELVVFDTDKQDNPYLLGLTPIMGIDVWEHAYYLKHRNKKSAYLNEWWNVANWDAIGKRYEAAIQ